MNEYICVGNKKNFAIEYMVCKKAPYLMGKICLWVNNLYIGDREEKIMLLTAKHYLSLRISQMELLRKDEFQSMNPEEVYNYIYEMEFNHSQYLLNICESFDDFSTIIYILGDSVSLVWKLYEDSSHKYPGYPLGINSASINLDNFRNTISQFESDINALT